MFCFLALMLLLLPCYCRGSDHPHGSGVVIMSGWVWLLCLIGYGCELRCRVKMSIYRFQLSIGYQELLNLNL